MNTKIIVTIVCAVLLLIGVSSSIFVIDETEQAIITQLGKYVKTVDEPALSTCLVANRLIEFQRIDYFPPRVVVDNEVFFIRCNDRLGVGLV